MHVRKTSSVCLTVFDDTFSCICVVLMPESQFFLPLPSNFRFIPPVLSSFSMRNMSVLNPKGLSIPFPRSLSFPIISETSLDLASSIKGGSVASAVRTVFLSVAGRVEK